MNYSKEFIAKQIKNFRLQYRLSQEQLAEKLGVSHMQILRWENKKTLPNKLSTKALQALKILPTNN